MNDIASSLNDIEFDDVNKCTTGKEMWDNLALVHGGDDNVLIEKE